MSDPPLLRPSQLARFLAIHPQTVSEWIHTGRLPAVRTPGNQFRLRAEDVRAFCERERLRVPTFALPRVRRAVVVGGSDALGRSIEQKLRATGVAFERIEEPLRGIVACVVAAPTVIAIDAKLPSRFAERAVRALREAPLEPKPRLVVFDVASVARCDAFTRAGANGTVTRARRADLAQTLVSLAGEE